MKKMFLVICSAYMIFLGGTGFLLAADELEQKFDGFNLQGYSDEGEKIWEVNGDTADIDGTAINLSNVDANIYGKQNVNLTADTGTVDQIKGNMSLKTDVIVTSGDGIQLLTDTLDWNRDDDLVSTEDDIVITDEGMTLTGTGMESRLDLKNIQVHKDVTVMVDTVQEKKEIKMLTITSDGSMVINQAKRKATFYDNVIAIQENQILKADRMDIYFNEEMDDIRKIICIGTVEIMQGENKTFAEKAVYNREEQTLILSGRPKLILITEGENAIASFGN